MPTTTSPSTDQVRNLFAQQQRHHSELKHTTAQERLERLARIDRYLQDDANLERLCDAMYQDYRKPEAEVLATEVMVLRQQYRHIRKNLKRWMRNQHIHTPLPLVGTRSRIVYEPKGVCLVMAPWNYPFMLALSPVLYAIAAGNAVVLKPSEISAHTSSYLAQMIKALFPQKEVAVVEGDASVAQALLALPFNHIFFTGSPQIGKIVMGAAAQHLASVTLELGGKSPAIVAPDAAIKSVAQKAAWGKCVNNGQTCIAPDYLLVHQSVKDEFVAAFCESIDQFYNKTPQESPHYGRIISDKHFKRIEHLLQDALDKGAKVVYGGQTDAADRYIAPTLLDEVTDDMEIMHEEIFGPLMPLRTWRTKEEALAIIQARPKPLTLYINSRDKQMVQYFLDHTSAGGTLINEFMLGVSNPDLPFGGINNSGVGKSLGFHGFVEFSNERGVMERKWGTLSPIYPPYTAFAKKIIRLLSRWA